MTTTDILNRAAEVIERDGFCQGFYFGRLHSSGKVEGHCIQGAIATVISHGRALCPETEGFEDDAKRMSVFGHCVDCVDVAIREQTTGDYRPVAYWNDEEGRTQEEVVMILRKAARNARHER